jgi:hypothetical protein
VQRTDNHLRSLLYYFQQTTCKCFTDIQNSTQSIQDTTMIFMDQLQILHLPKGSIACYNKSLYPSCAKIKCLSPNNKQFKISLKTVLLIPNFYIADYFLFRVSATSSVIGQITTVNSFSHMVIKLVQQDAKIQFIISFWIYVNMCLIAINFCTFISLCVLRTKLIPQYASDIKSSHRKKCSVYIIEEWI